MIWIFYVFTTVFTTSRWLACHVTNNANNASTKALKFIDKTGQWLFFWTSLAWFLCVYSIITRLQSTQITRLTVLMMLTILVFKCHETLLQKIQKPTMEKALVTVMCRISSVYSVTCFQQPNSWVCLNVMS